MDLTLQSNGKFHPQNIIFINRKRIFFNLNIMVFTINSHKQFLLKRFVLDKYNTLGEKIKGKSLFLQGKNLLNLFYEHNAVRFKVKGQVFCYAERGVCVFFVNKEYFKIAFSSKINFNLSIFGIIIIGIVCNCR